MFELRIKLSVLIGVYLRIENWFDTKMEEGGED
jgi:hypothetical protein